MNENGNSEQPGGTPLAAPPVPPVPPVPPMTAPAGMMPPAEPKQKMDVLFFILGLVSPAVLLGLLGAISVYAQSNLMVWFSQAFTGLLFFAYVAAFAVGKSKRNRRLWSFGLGGMAAYALGGILLLLAFGTCLVALSGSGL